MEDKRKFQDEVQTEVENTVEARQPAEDELSDEQLKQAAGGSPMTDAVNQTIKAVGEALNSAARKG
jgi:hypothetical protein